MSASRQRRTCLAAIAALALVGTGLRAQARPAATTPARAAAGAAADTAAVRAAVERVTPAMIEVRHDLHQHPELGNRETRTAGIVADRLRALGLEVRTGVAHTGVVGVLRGGRPGPVVALRADMDALPVTEATDLPFRSTARATYNGQDVGVMHACGHDLHTAILLGTASVLAGMRERLPGTVLLVFQPAEEGPPAGEDGGARMMLAEGAFRDPRPSAVFGLHTMAEMPVGQLGYTPGPALASATGFRAVIRGRQAHGARPELSVDPIVTASQVVLALQTIRARNLSPFAPTVLTVGMLHSGERGNIIPAEARMEGTVRTYDRAVLDTIERRMREVFDGVTRSANATYTLDFDEAYPVTVNDTALTARMLPTLQRAVGREHVSLIPPATVSEDFSYFANDVPGFYFRLGVLKAGTVSGDHHSPTFLADDSAIPVGIRAMTALVLDYFGAGGR
ncbi:MAG: amidohydrolase [Gemmatimonadota bacterium]